MRARVSHTRLSAPVAEDDRSSLIRFLITKRPIEPDEKIHYRTYLNVIMYLDRIISFRIYISRGNAGRPFRVDI
jgi:hypothetical protein